MPLILTQHLPSLPRLHRPFAQLARHVAAYLRALESRRALARMDDHMLSDIGISRVQAEFEVNRKPWGKPK